MSQIFSGGENPFDFDHRYQSPFYTEDHHAWRATLRRFIEKEILPFVDEWEEAGEFPRELYKKASAVGLIGMGYPEAFGGTPVADGFFSIITSEEMARIGAGGINASLLVHGIGLPPILAIGSRELQQRIAPQVLTRWRLPNPRVAVMSPTFKRVRCSKVITIGSMVRRCLLPLACAPISIPSRFEPAVPEKAVFRSC